MKLRHISTHDGKHYGVGFHCLGCDDEHIVTTLPYPNGWTFNGDDERPTLTPSILVYSHPIMKEDGAVTQTPRCHSYVKEGKIEYLADCTHALAGQTIELPDFVGE